MMDCDLLVLGAGGAGLVAGNKAFDLTGKKVIILEKTKKPSGCTYFATFMGEAGPIKDSKWQKDAGYKVNEDPQDLSGQFFDWLAAATKGDAEKYFYISKDTEIGMKGGGMITGAGHINIPMRPEVEGKYKDLPDDSIGPGKMGSWVVDHLSERCKKVGITLLTETRARKFLKDDTGKVSACVADTKDGQLVVNFKACVIAAGGYGANKDLLKKYYPKQFSGGGKIHSLCPPAMTGDCILAAEEAGAYIDPTIGSLSFPGGFYGDGMMRHPWNMSVQSLTSGKCVVINLDGKRWKNERDSFGGSGNLADQPNGVGIAIVDSDMVEAAAAQKGGNMMMGDPSKMKEHLDWEAAMDDAGASGNHTRKADTIVELALKMKIDPRTLVDTIERYNKFCETGKDLDFGKSAGMLVSIKKAPFYAIFCNRWSQSTKGRNGIAVNSRFQVLNPKGEVMPGLYAAGDGCTIFGGFVIGKPNPNLHNYSEEETKARTALSRELAQTSSTAQGNAAPAGFPGGGFTGAGASGAGGAPGGAAAPSGAGAPGGQGNGMMSMMMMGAKTDSADIFKGTSSPCGGLGPAFLSGYCAGAFAGKYLKDL